MRWCPVIFLCCSVGACGAPVRQPAPTRVAPWLRADPHRCLVRRDLHEGMEVMARRCAEAFVRENGYTDAPAQDSTRWVREAGEWDAWPRVLAWRSGSLAGSASAVQCSTRTCVVLFRVRRSVLTCAFRAVTMTQVYTKIMLAPGGIRDARCAERRA